MKSQPLGLCPTTGFNVCVHPTCMVAGTVCSQNTVLTEEFCGRHNAEIGKCHYERITVTRALSHQVHLRLQNFVNTEGAWGFMLPVVALESLCLLFLRENSEDEKAQLF